MKVLTHSPATAADTPAVGVVGLELRPGDVDVWRIRLDAPPPASVEFLRETLSRDEQERASLFYFERDWRRYVVGRGVLRVLLGRYLGRAPHEVGFAYGANGKPMLAGEPGEGPLYFNVAHSDDLALIAVTREGEIGIDVERVRDMPDWQQVAEAAFSPQELTQLQACPPERRRSEFFRAWTRQEAVLKALGTGLGGASTAALPPVFQVYPMDPGPGYVAALAAMPRAVCPAVVRDWTFERAPRAEAGANEASSQWAAPVPALHRLNPSFL